MAEEYQTPAGQPREVRSHPAVDDTHCDFPRSAIESVPLPLAVLNLEFGIRAVNVAFRTLAGIAEGDVGKHSLRDLTAGLSGLEEPLRIHLEELRSSLDSGKDFAFQQRTGGNHVRLLHVRGTVVKPDGEHFLLVTIEDISACRENELRALAASLLTSQESERRRVARELHDDICQRLAKLEIDMQQIEGQPSSKDLHHRLADLRADAGALSEEVRRISHALHPSVLEDLGLKPAIRSLVDEFHDRDGMIVTFRSEGVPDCVPLDITTGLYRITQEALRSVSGHARQTHVRVSLNGDTGHIRLRVEDCGKGLDAHVLRFGLGLICMEERARIIQGTLHIASAPGEGTTITVDVPLPDSD